MNILDPDGEARALPSKVTRTMSAGEVIRHEQAGGGGYGDPLRRDPMAVAEDIRDEKISPDFAKEQFGVILAADGLEVDMAATEDRRRQLRST